MHLIIYKCDESISLLFGTRVNKQTRNFNKHDFKSFRYEENQV